MKKTIILSALLATTFSAQAALITVGTGAPIPGSTSGATYTTTNWADRTGPLPGFQMDQNDTTATISFDNLAAGEVITLIISHIAGDNTSNNPVTWNGAATVANVYATFLADAGTLLSNITAPVTDLTVNPANTGLSFGARTVGSGPDPGVSMGEAWGTLTYTGLTSLTYSTGTANGLDGYSFNVTSNGVPEPSSTALLGLGALSLMIRRRR